MSDTQLFVPTHALYINGACVCEFYIDENGYWVDQTDFEEGEECPYQFDNDIKQPMIYVDDHVSAISGNWEIVELTEKQIRSTKEIHSVNVELPKHNMLPTEPKAQQGSLVYAFQDIVNKAFGFNSSPELRKAMLALIPDFNEFEKRLAKIEKEHKEYSSHVCIR